MTRPIAALRSPTLMNILANFSFWLTPDSPAMSPVRRLFLQQETFECRYRCPKRSPLCLPPSRRPCLGLAEEPPLALRRLDQCRHRQRFGAVIKADLAQGLYPRRRPLAIVGGKLFRRMGHGVSARPFLGASCNLRHQCRKFDPFVRPCSAPAPCTGGAVYVQV